MSIAFVLRRAAALIPVLLGVTILVFALIHLTPGDPVQLIMGSDYTEEGAAIIRARLHLDQPLITQYVTWLRNVVAGDLGTSLFNNQPVIAVLMQRIPTTLELAFGGLLFGLVVGMPLGVAAAVRPGSMADHVTRIAALFGVSVPVYWLGLVLIEFLAVRAGLFPPGGSIREYGIQVLVLPCISVGAGFAGVIARTTRSAMIECLGEGYVDTANAKGLPHRRVLWIHAIRNALVPIVTVVGLQFGVLLGGAVITETIFALPGIGQLLMQSISQRDFPVMQGCVLLIAVGFVLVNFVTDLLYSVIDPRIRLE